jgi:hypothetical protein
VFGRRWIEKRAIKTKPNNVLDSPYIYSVRPDMQAKKINSRLLKNFKFYQNKQLNFLHYPCHNENNQTMKLLVTGKNQLA